MRKIFDVELSAQSRCTELALPATPWSMQDALEKLKLREDESPHCEILRIHSCGELYPYLKHADALFELNALCQQLALLDEAQISILEGLVKMEYGQQDEQPAPCPGSLIWPAAQIAATSSHTRNNQSALMERRVR